MAITWIGVFGAPKDEVFRNLGFADLSQQGPVNEFRSCYIEQPNGWLIVLTGIVDPSIEVMNELSRGGWAIKCLLDTESIFSLAQGHQRGDALWSVIHGDEPGEPDVEALGNLPEAFAEISDRLLELQRSVVRGQIQESPYRAPEELAYSVTGFRLSAAVEAGRLATYLGGRPARSTTRRRLIESRAGMFRR